MKRQRHAAARGLLALVFVASLMAGWVTALADEATPPVVPTVVPTEVPAEIPTEVPTQIPTELPAEVPTEVPTQVPTEAPSGVATEVPTETPGELPTETPTEVPAAEGTETPDASFGALSLLTGDGVLVVTATEATSGGTVTGVCFSLFVNVGGARGEFVTENCDFFDDADDGQTTIDGLAAGSYVLAATFVEPGSGYVIGGDRVITVAATGTTSVTFQMARGGRDVLVLTVDEDGGATVVGACFDVYEDLGGGEFGNWVSSNCDGPSNAEGNGVTELPGLPTGRNYILSQFEAPAGYAFSDDLSFSLAEGSGPHIISVSHVSLASLGSLVINKRDEVGELLPGACFSIFTDAGAGQRGDEVANACDWDDGAFDGQFEFVGLEPGSYVLSEYHAPDGYINGFRTTFSITGNEAVVLDVPNTPGGSDISVRAVDRDTDVLLIGACYLLERDDGSGVPGTDTFVEGRCDNSDGSDDGITPFTGLAAGNYILSQFDIQDGYVLIPGYVTFSVDGTTDPTITVENVAIDSPGNLIVTKVDEHGVPLAGACFSIIEQDGGNLGDFFIETQCAIQLQPIVFSGLTPGTYLLVESHAPDGYITGVRTPVTVSSTQATFVTVPNMPGGSSITVRTVDRDTDALLLGACYEVHRNNGSGQPEGNETVIEFRCDHWDSFFANDDGLTTFSGLAAGDYVLWQYDWSEEYMEVRYVPFTVDGTSDVTVTVENARLSEIELIVQAIIAILIQILAEL